MKIGIIGPGVVGKAVGNYYKKRNYKVVYFDKGDEITLCDLYYICVPKDKDVLDVMDKLPPHPLNVIIKSTISPLTIDKWKEHRADELIYSPEFLNNDTAEFDYESELPLNIGNKEAILVKLATNFYYAMKVIFFNMIYDICQANKLDYEQIRRYLIDNPDIGDSHSEIWHKDYRGYGGHCIPKDVKILIDYMREIKVYPILPELIQSINEKYKEK